MTIFIIQWSDDSYYSVKWRFLLLSEVTILIIQWRDDSYCSVNWRILLLSEVTILITERSDSFDFFLQLNQWGRRDIPSGEGSDCVKRWNVQHILQMEIFLSANSV